MTFEKYTCKYEPSNVSFTRDQSFLTAKKSSLRLLMLHSIYVLSFPATNTAFLPLPYSRRSDVALRIEFHDFMAPISSSSWSYPKRGGLDAFFTAASASNFSFSNFRFSSMTMRFNATLDGRTLVYCLTKMRFFSESGVNISTNA